jgi:hypothetical protein
LFVTWVNEFVGGLYRLLWGEPLPQTHHRDGELLLCLLGITCLAFGFEITNPTLGVDDYTQLALHFDWEPFWISRGMWGSLLLQYLMPGGWITPFITLTIAILLQCLTAMVVGWSLHLNALTYKQRFVSYALFTTFPYFAGQMAFTNMQIGYTLSSFLCIAGLALSQGTSLLRPLVGVVLIAFSISIYQGCISLLVTGAALYSLYIWFYSEDSNTAEKSFRTKILCIGRIFFVIGAGATIYYLAHKSILAYTGLSSGEGYYEVRFDLAFWERWSDITSTIRFLVLGDYGFVPHTAQLIFFIVLGFVVYKISVSKTVGHFIVCLPVAIFFICLLMLSPFTILFIHEGGLAPRSSLGVGLLWLATWALAFEIQSGRFSKKILSVSALAVLFIFVFQINRVFYSEYLVERADALNITRMAERVVTLDLQNGEQNINGVVVLGAYSYPPYPSRLHYCGSVLGRSMLDWNNVDPHGPLTIIANAYGIIQHASNEYPWVNSSVFAGQVDTKALVATRHAWPHAEALFQVEDYAVLWLGERNYVCGEGSFQEWLTGWLPSDGF